MPSYSFPRANRVRVCSFPSFHPSATPTLPPPPPKLPLYGETGERGLGLKASAGLGRQRAVKTALQTPQHTHTHLSVRRPPTHCRRSGKKTDGWTGTSERAGGRANRSLETGATRGKKPFLPLPAVPFTLYFHLSLSLFLIAIAHTHTHTWDKGLCATPASTTPSPINSLMVGRTLPKILSPCDVVDS